MDVGVPDILKTPAVEANDGWDKVTSLVFAGTNALKPVPETRAEIVIVGEGTEEKEASTSGLPLIANESSWPILTSVLDTAFVTKEYSRPFMKVEYVWEALPVAGPVK